MTTFPPQLALISFYAFFVLFVVVEKVVTRGALGEKGRGDRDPATILFFVFPAAGTFVWIFVMKRWFPAHPSWGLWSSGVAAAIGGLGIRAAAKRTLGRFFTIRVQLQEGHRLVRSGLYARIRHPLYTGFILAWCAPPLLVGSPIGLLVLTLPQAILLLRRIPREEALLLEAFGPEYRDYMATTKRLLPGIW